MPQRKIRAATCTLALSLFLPAAVGWAEWRSLGELDRFEQAPAVVTLHCGEAAVRVEAVSDGVIRVRLAPGGEFGRDFSWAVEDLAPQGGFTGVEEETTGLVLNAGALRVHVQRDPCRLTVVDATGRVLAADEAGRGMSWEAADDGELGGVRVWQTHPDGTAIFGLGEKAGGLNKGNQTWTMWNTDAYAYDANTDPLYISVPFYLARREGVFHGVFFDNPWRSAFDFGKLERGVMSFGAEGGELNYYVIAGPTPQEVLRRYTDLVGRIELPPKWAIGYHQCRYSYYPEDRVREVAATFREKRIPCDVLWFDIDYMDGYRCFTWSPQYFPGPKKLIDDLHGMGFHTIAIVDPGIKAEPGYAVYDAGTAQGAWLTTPEGDPYVGRVWPGDCVFPDFTNPAVREWWADLFPPFLQGCGLDGMWNDMNEPANFAGPNGTVPLDLRHDNEGEPAPHRACHNVYGMQMARATKAGLQRAYPDRRAFTLTRASYAGGQRYGAAWTGDNVSSWPHMQMSIPMALNLGLSGMPFVGPDIGGFVRGASPQLFARWVQVGTLFPFARTHTGAGNPDQEPWSFGPEVEAVAREALERRYALLPYLYTLFEEASRTGMPILRPVWFVDPDYPKWAADTTFLLGPDIFVAPVLSPGEEDVWVRPPAGVWFDGNTGLIHGGGRSHKVAGDLGALPHFIRAGAIIPMQSPVQHTSEAPAESLIVDVWPRGESTGALYEDDGHSLAYRDGAFRRTRFKCVLGDDGLTFTMEAIEGEYPAPQRKPLLRIHGLGRDIARVTCASAMDPTRLSKSTHGARSEQTCADPGVPQPGDFHHDAATNTWLVRMYDDGFKVQQVRIQFAQAGEQAAQPVVLDFARPGDALVSYRFMSAPVYADGAVTLTVRRPWENLIRLPRLNVAADALPILELRLATESTRRMGLRFALEEDPEALRGEGLGFEVTPDGKGHDYRIDLQELCGPAWTGTVYEFHLALYEGVRAGERVRLERVAFVPRSE